jgi:hypothetical protein
MSGLRCPRCGGPVDVVSPGNQNYPASFACYAHGGRYVFSATHSGVDKAAAKRQAQSSLALSAANAKDYSK